MFRADPEWREKAARVSALARDVTELLAEIGLGPPAVPTGLRVAYLSACSMQPAQQIGGQPKYPQAAHGFEVEDEPEGHLSSASSGTSHLLQPHSDMTPCWK